MRIESSDHLSTPLTFYIDERTSESAKWKLLVIESIIENLGDLEELLEGLIHKDPKAHKDTDSNGDTLLHLCCKHNNILGIQILLELGFHEAEPPLFEINRQRLTPLALALNSGHFEVLKHIVSHLLLKKKHADLSKIIDQISFENFSYKVSNQIKKFLIELKIEDTSESVSLRQQLETLRLSYIPPSVANSLLCLNFSVPFIEGKAKTILETDDFTQPLHAISNEKIQRFLTEFGIGKFLNKNHRQISTVSNLISKIHAHKNRGIIFQKGYLVMRNLITQFLMLQSNLSAIEIELLKSIERSLNFYLDQVTSYIDEILNNPPQNKKKNLISELIESIITKFQDHSEAVGLFLGLGWEDHSVNIELCKIDGHSHLSVTNAGEAPLGFHSTSFPMSEELPHGYITNLYAVESNEKLRVLLEQLLLLLETPRKNLKEDPASLFYELLNQCPMLASQDSPRPLQQGPHCVTYNLQEGIACALRRNGAYELANRFLLFIKEQAAQAPNCAAQQELLNELVGS